MAQASGALDHNQPTPTTRHQGFGGSSQRIHQLAASTTASLHRIACHPHQTTTNLTLKQNHQNDNEHREELIQHPLQRHQTEIAGRGVNHHQHPQTQQHLLSARSLNQAQHGIDKQRHQQNIDGINNAKGPGHARLLRWRSRKSRGRAASA